MATKRELTAEPSFGDSDLSHNTDIIQAAEEMGLFGDSTGPGGTIPMSPSKRLIIPTPNASASIRRVADQREQLVLSATSSVNAANSFFPLTQNPVSYLHATYTQSPSPGPFDTSTGSVGTSPVGGSFVSNSAIALGTQGFLAPNTNGYSMPATGSYYPQQPQHYQPYPTQQPQFSQPHRPQTQPYLSYQPPLQNVDQPYVQAALASTSVPQPGSNVLPTSTISSPVPTLPVPAPSPSTPAVSNIPTSTVHLSVSNVSASPVPPLSTPAMSDTPALTPTLSVPLPVSNVPTSPLPPSSTPTASDTPALDVPTLLSGSNVPITTGDTPSTPSGSIAKAADKANKSNSGRPSKELIAKVEACVKRLEKRIEDEAEDLGVESSLIYNGLGVSRKSQRSKSPWNRYQSFCMAIDNVDDEMARLKDHPTLRYDGNFPPSQTQVGEAYDAFMRYHGKEKGKELLKSWSAMQELQVVTQKVERNKTFSSCVTQAFNLANHFRNKGIYMFAAVAGGNVGTDQRLVKVVSVPETEKFLESGLLIEPEAFPGLFQAAVFEGTSLTYTKHQIANKARELGLIVSGPGLDTLEVPKASTTKPSSSKSQPAKKKEDTASGLASRLRTMVLDLAIKQVGGFKKKNILPWSTMAVEQLEKGIRVLGYPAKTQYPWKLLDLPSEQRSRGIQNMSPEDQNRLLKACGEDQAVPLSFAKVDPIRLTENEVPMLETAPDENGRVTRVFYRELEPYLLEKKVLRPLKQVKPTSEHDEDEVDQLSDLTDEDEPTPQPNKKAAGKPKVRGKSTNKIKVKSVATLPDNIDDESDDPKDQRVTPSPAEMKKVEASSSNGGAVKAKPSISAAELTRGTRRPTETEKPAKRPAETRIDDAPNKRRRHDAPEAPVVGKSSASAMPALPPVSTPTASVQPPPTASVQPPPPIVSAQPVQSQPAVVHAQHLRPQQLPPGGGMQPPPFHTPHHPPPTGGMQEAIARLQQAHMTQIAQLQQQISAIPPEQQAQILDPIRQAHSAQLQQLVMSFLTPPSQAQVPPPGGYRQ